jgi:hypothetical protein
MSFIGYSVLPPAGENWFLTETSGRKVVFAKEIAVLHTLVATVTTAPVFLDFDSPEDFVTWAKQARERDRDPHRYRLIEHQETLDRSLNAYCSKYHLKSEDSAAPGADGKSLILELDGYSCMHPSVPSLLIDISYSERYDPVKHTPIGKTEGESYFKTFTFDSVEQDVLERWIYE